MNQLVRFQSCPLAKGLSTQLAHKVLYTCRTSHITAGRPLPQLGGWVSGWMGAGRGSHSSPVCLL